MRGLFVAPGNYNVKQVAYRVGGGSFVRDFNGTTWSSWTDMADGAGAAHRVSSSLIL